ncbi:hypothetical protein Pelo_8327 [Pelomyxa schiedti]|nr:hypothetical protein Pelo_8327 [Pelomyxa schiedti]
MHEATTTTTCTTTTTAVEHSTTSVSHHEKHTTGGDGDCAGADVGDVAICATAGDAKVKVSGDPSVTAPLPKTHHHQHNQRQHQHIHHQNQNQRAAVQGNPKATELDCGAIENVKTETVTSSAISATTTTTNSYVAHDSSSNAKGSGSTQNQTPIKHVPSKVSNQTEKETSSEHLSVSVISTKSLSPSRLGEPSPTPTSTRTKTNTTSVHLAHNRTYSHPSVIPSSRQAAGTANPGLTVPNVGAPASVRPTSPSFIKSAAASTQHKEHLNPTHENTRGAYNKEDALATKASTSTTTSTTKSISTTSNLKPSSKSVLATSSRPQIKPSASATKPPPTTMKQTATPLKTVPSTHHSVSTKLPPGNKPSAISSTHNGSHTNQTAVSTKPITESQVKKVPPASHVDQHIQAQPPHRAVIPPVRTAGPLPAQTQIRRQNFPTNTHSTSAIQSQKPVQSHSQLGQYPKPAQKPLPNKTTHSSIPARDHHPTAASHPATVTADQKPPRSRNDVPKPNSSVPAKVPPGHSLPAKATQPVKSNTGTTHTTTSNKNNQVPARRPPPAEPKANLPQNKPHLKQASRPPPKRTAPITTQALEKHQASCEADATATATLTTTLTASQSPSPEGRPKRRRPRVPPLKFPRFPYVTVHYPRPTSPLTPSAILYRHVKV